MVMILWAALLTICGELSSSQPTRYLYLDHWAYRYIDLLQDRGHMRDLGRSIKPYQRGDIARSVLELMSISSLGDAERGWLELLREEFAEDINQLAGDDSKTRYFVRGIFREDADIVDDQRDADYLLSAETLIRIPALVFSSRISIDQRLFDDPHFRGRKDISIAGRVEDSYLLARFSSISLFFGRTERSWSPFTDMSLALSGEPFSYDHFFLRIGGERLALRSLFARLSDLPSGASGVDGEQRYFTAHRLDFRLGNWLQMGLFESSVYGGKGKGLDLALLNPFVPYVIVENSSSREMNSFIGLDMYLVPHRDITVSMQLLIDDVKLSLFGKPIFHGDEVEPNEFGFAIGGTCRDPLGLTNSILRARYLKVTRYTYNTPDSLERYLHEGISLGAGNGNDFDEVMIDVDYFPVKSWIVSASALFKRAGEGLISEPFPEEFLTEDIPFPSGIIEKTHSFLAGLRYQPSAVWFLRGRLGFDNVKNRDHVNGEDDVYVRGDVSFQISWWRWLN
jgi:hypothetical protein